MSSRSVARLSAILGLLAASAIGAPATGSTLPPDYHASVAAESVAALVEIGLDPATATARLTAARDVGVRGERLTRALGASAAGFWLDLHTGELVVNVLDGRAAQAVSLAGARPQPVSRGGDVLRGIIRELDRRGGPVGTAWGIDDSTNQVVVMIPDGAVTQPGIDGLLAAAGAHGDAVRVERVPGSLDVDLRGGEAIFNASSGSRCSAGFNVIPGWPEPSPPDGGSRVLTAGHCTVGFPSWRVGSIGGPYLGPTIGASFPGNDYGIIRNDGGQPLPRTVNLYNGSSQTITSGGDPYLNRPVCKSGSTTRLTCGRITATNVTVTYASGTVYGLARGNLCANGGDSGGPWFEGPTAVGLHSGSNRLCPGTALMQPVGEAMRAYNVFFPNS